MNDPLHRRPTLFSLDQTGNWDNYTIQESGTTILNQDRTANAVNEIATIDGSTAYIGYDAAGNLTKMPGGTSAFLYVYDAWNRRVQYKYGTYLASTYVYDGMHRLLSETGINRLFYYTAQWQIAEDRELSAPTITYSQYVWGQFGKDNIVLRDRPNVPDRYYALSDYASVRAIVDTSGTLKERTGYHAYGAPYFMNPDWSFLGWSYVDWLVLFNSVYISPQTWFYQMRNRVLNSTLGTWLTRDPIGYAGGLNLYAYCGNSPVTLTDPMGLGPNDKYGSPYYGGTINDKPPPLDSHIPIQNDPNGPVEGEMGGIAAAPDAANLLLGGLESLYDAASGSIVDGYVQQGIASCQQQQSAAKGSECIGCCSVLLYRYLSQSGQIRSHWHLFGPTTYEFVPPSGKTIKVEYKGAVYYSFPCSQLADGGSFQSKESALAGVFETHNSDLSNPNNCCNGQSGS